MRALTLLHRWLGVAFCLLFAMWFATGIVMHFVPFPALTETERAGGLAAINVAAVVLGPADAVAAGKIKDATRVRLLQRPDGPVYLVSGLSGVVALRAADLADAALRAPPLALAIATDYARRRGLDFTDATVAGLASYDQWTVSGGFDPHRPLYRIALDDGPGTELYVSSRTGEIVLDTTRWQRAWNYLGSVAHWIYPTALRSRPAAWSWLLWWLSLLALIGASTGGIVGTLRMGADGVRLTSPYTGIQAWHHWLGLCCMLFVLTWIFSGWLSMDNGRLFSIGIPTDAEITSIAGTQDWQALPRDEIQRVSTKAVEVEWFAFGGQLYRRERISAGVQRLFHAGSHQPESEFLPLADVDAAARHLARGCDSAVVVGPGDHYPAAAIMPDAPVFRVVCGADWFHIDSASGALLEKLEPSRRVYRWLYGALHTLNFPILTARPALRTFIIVLLCGCGFAFSLTGVVIAWRRLRSCFRPSG
jgi:hypothetical protein